LALINVLGKAMERNVLFYSSNRFRQHKYGIEPEKTMYIKILPFVFYITFFLFTEAVKFGNEIFRESGFSPLNVGDRVAILSNPTGVFQDSLTHIVDEMTAYSKSKEGDSWDVVAILGPEHGFRGDLQAETGDPRVYIDTATNLPVYSAYSIDPVELAKILDAMEVTAVVVDMQDVGVRLYTFIWTMYDVMTAVSKMQNKATKFIVLDRPNPIGGDVVSGPLLNETCCSSGYGKYPIPHVHGMTIGELANLFGVPQSVDVNIVKMTGYDDRSRLWRDLDLVWVPPSPNLPTPDSVLAYPVTVFIEATTVAEGRGTTTPFQMFGAPFLSSFQLAADLNNPALGLCVSDFMCFRASAFNPTFSKYNGTVCNGVQWIGSRSPYGDDYFYQAVAILQVLMRESGDEFVWDGSWFGHPGTKLIDEYAGTPLLREALDKGSELSARQIADMFVPDQLQFRESRKPFLLY
jgi:uncharacterized protein YbbC (DUF1343 family)